MLLLLSIVVTDTLGYGLLVPLLPFYAQRFEQGAVFVGGLRALYAGLQLICGPVLGALSDRYGRKPVIVLCLLGTTIAYLLIGLAPSWEWLVVAVVLDGLTGANLSTAQAYLADVTAPEERARAFGWLGAAFGLGVMAGPTLGGLLSTFGLGVPALVAAGLAGLNVLLGGWRLPESLPQARRRLPSATAFNPFGSLWELLRRSTVWRWLTIVFLMNVVFSGLQTVFPLFSQVRFNWDARANGLLFGFVGLCAVITQGGLVGQLQPRIGAVRLVQIGLVIMALAIASVGANQADVWLYPLVAGAAIGSGLAVPTLGALISNAVREDEQGLVSGGLQTLIGLAMMLGPALAGGAFEALGPDVLPWLGAIIVGVAVLFSVGRTIQTT